MAKMIILLLCSLATLSVAQRFDSGPQRARPSVPRPPLPTPAPAPIVAPTSPRAPSPPPPPPPPPQPAPSAAPAQLWNTIMPQQNARSSICERKNSRYPIPGQCDGYVECRNWQPFDMMCPDGLHFNPDAPLGVYPCGYPIDVPCRERSALQPAQPTAECPHRFGYFRGGDSLNCGSYRACVDGKAFGMQCAMGLAWNQDSYKCDWPDQVPDCDVEGFLGFTCPPLNLDMDGNPLIEDRFFSNPKSCFMYFDCLNEKPRLLSCDQGLAFDERLGRCVDSDLVQACRRR